MDYKLFDELITLQALLKDTGIIPSGGAAKAFLADFPVLLNGQAENRRGKKLRVGDVVTLPTQQVTVTLVAASPEEQAQHAQEQIEKARVQALVKKMNQDLKKKQGKSRKSGQGSARTQQKSKQSGATQTWRAPQTKTGKPPVRFPGT